MDDVCNLSKGVWNEGMQKGIEKGIEKGILSAIQNLMESMEWSAEQAMDALKIPAGHKPAYRSKLSIFS